MKEYIEKQTLMQWLQNNPKYSIELPISANPDTLNTLLNTHQKMIEDGIDNMTTISEQEVTGLMAQYWKKQGAVEFANMVIERLMGIKSNDAIDEGIICAIGCIRKTIKEMGIN